MIRLKNTRSSQRVYIPRRAGDDGVGEYSFTLREVSGDGKHAAEINGAMEQSSMYYTADIVLPRLPRGEYRYTMRRGSKIVATGVALVGDYEEDVVQHAADIGVVTPHLDYQVVQRGEIIDTISQSFDITTIERTQDVDFDSYDPSIDIEVYIRVSPSFVWLDAGNDYSATFDVESNTDWQVFK